MLQLLNKLAWAISFISGFLSIIVIAILSGGLNSYGFAPSLIFYGIILGLILKKVLFSENYIRSRLGMPHQQSPQTQSIPANYEQKVVHNSDGIAQETSFVSDTATHDQESVVYKGADDADPFILSESLHPSEYEEPKSYTPETPSEPGFVARFFSENLLAKVGGILVFLGVLFFLSLIYTVVGPLAKVVIGFMMGIGCFLVGVWMDKKGFENESRIVMGLGILINYLVILGGRYLLGDDSSSGATFFSVAATFMFLIMNTIFAVAVSLFYNSRPLLIFAFVFAYLNPFLLGSSSSEPYTLLGYTMIVTLGAMYVSYREKDEILFPLAFILPACIFLVAPWSDGAGWITKLLCINVLGALSLYVSTYFKKTYSFIYEILIAGTFFLIGIMGFLGIETLSSLQLGIMGVSSLGLMVFCYAFMNRGVYLYSLGTVGTILTMTPVILMNGFRPDTVLICSVILVIFATLNIGVIALRNKDLLADNLDNVVSGLVSGVLFLTFMIYTYGNKYFEDIGQGITFFGLGIVYAGLTYFIINKLTLSEVKHNEKYKNLCYTTAAIALSLVSLAVAFLFAESKEAISVIWLLEATILFFVTQKLKSLKVAIGALILFVIGILRFPPLVDNFGFYGNSLGGNYSMLIVGAIVLISLISNLYILSKEREDSELYFSKEIIGIHNFFHVIGMVTLSVMTYEILDISSIWYGLLYFSVVLSALGLLYDRLGSKSLQVVHLLTYFGFLALHVIMFFDAMKTGNVNLLVSTSIIGVFTLPYIYNYIVRGTIGSRSLFTLFVLYLFVISTLYVQHIFDITFAVTIYWGVLAFALLSYGISKDILYMRTIGLYIITLTAGKIFFHDIWVGVDNLVSRVAALMIVGVLMIVISTMYTRRYGSKINDEFSLSNLFPDVDFGGSELYENNQVLKQDQSVEESNLATKNSMMDDIASVDVSGIKSVKININEREKAIRVRSKKLTQIIKIVTDTTGRQEFGAGELTDIYDNITNNYKSDLPAAQYKRIKEIMKAFVDHGGEVEFIEE